VSLDAIVWVFRNAQATLGRRLVLLVLADFAHEDGTKSFPKVETIAEKARMSRKAVQTALRRLEDDGEIVCTGTTRSGTRIYSIVGMQPGENAGDNDAEGRSSRPEGAKNPTSRGVETTPDPTKDPSETLTEVEIVAATWGKLAPPLIRHPTAYFTADRFARAVAHARKTYELAAIVKAVENYAQVLASPAHWWTHRYPAIDFLRRERATPGLEKFVDEAMPFENFRQRRDDDREGKQMRTPADQLLAAEQWVLQTAYRLPLDEHELVEALGQRGVEGPDRARLVDLWRQKRELAA
jgi:hypothetical protein